MNPTQIPKSIVDLATQTASKPIASFSEFISLKLFGKSIAKLKAEAENTYDETRQLGKIERNIQEPFIVQIETAKAYRQYSNLGKTLMKATPLITTEKNKIADDNDVFWGFLEHSKEISSTEMQELIAKIIAGEYNTPGTYAMSTLQIIKMLGKHELELFEKISSLLINNEQLPEVLFTGHDNVKNLMQDLGVDFAQFQTLQSIGLFLPNHMSKSILNQEKNNLLIQYFDKQLIYSPENDNYLHIQLPNYYGLSMVGKQILTHLKPNFLEKYYIWLKDNYKVPKYKLN